MTIEEILAALQNIVDTAQGRSLTDEEATRYEELESELKRAQKSDEIQKRNAAYNTATTSPVTGTAPKGDDTLERAFAHYLRTGQPNSDLIELRAQSEGTGTAGGYLVPDVFRNKLVDRLKDFGGLANEVEEITTESGAPMEWPTVDDTGNVGEIVAENGTFAAGADIVFGTAVLGAYKYMAGGAGAQPLRVSWELLQDAAFDVEGFLTRKLGERIARIQAQHWVSGTGSAQPKGITTGKTLTEMPTAINYANLLKVVHSLDPAYRANAKWALNDTTLAAVEGIVDTTGRPLLNSSTDGISGRVSGQTLLGYPVVIDQGFANYAPTTNAAAGVFGDLKEAYVIRRVKDIILVANPYSRAQYGQTEFFAWARADGTQQNPNAYVAFSGDGAQP